MLSGQRVLVAAHPCGGLSVLTAGRASPPASAGAPDDALGRRELVKPALAARDAEAAALVAAERSVRTRARAAVDGGKPRPQPGSEPVRVTAAMISSAAGFSTVTARSPSLSVRGPPMCRRYGFIGETLLQGELTEQLYWK